MDTLERSSCDILLCETRSTEGHCWKTLVRHFGGTLLWDIVRHSRRPLWRDILMRHFCEKLLSDTSLLRLSLLSVALLKDTAAPLVMISTIVAWNGSQTSKNPQKPMLAQAWKSSKLAWPNTESKSLLPATIAHTTLRIGVALVVTCRGTWEMDSCGDQKNGKTCCKSWSLWYLATPCQSDLLPVKRMPPTARLIDV